jgi:outer membrane protein
MRRLLLALVFAASPAAAQDVLQVYRDAKAYDAKYASARQALQAGLEKLPQGRALLLPSLNLSAATTTNHLELTPYGPTPVPAGTRTFYNRNYVLNFSQPVFRAQNWAQYDQAEQQVRQAEAVFGQASQDLILRVVQAYVDVLAAQDSLGLVNAQKAAISEQLAQAKRNFEVDTATITDTHEAQGRYDLTVAQGNVAQNEVDTRIRALQRSRQGLHAASGCAPTSSSPPNPANMQSWVDLAENSPTLW